MSIAGIRSNRGDVYQTLVAFDWALTVLSDQNYTWLEIDSITYSVDDVVIGKSDGSLIACQCKKNQVDFKAWTIADLGEELDKAFNLLANNPNAEVRFYSRNNFSSLAKLKEHSAIQQDEISYRASLGKEHLATDTALSLRLKASATGLSVFDFLRRTTFVTTDELDRMEVLLRERLRNLASNPDNAFDALWVRLDQLGGRVEGKNTSIATPYRLSKDDLSTILHDAGAMLAYPMNLAEVRISFASTSAIGRSWRRDIAGQQISRPTVDKLISAIEAKKRSILLTGMPGSGKTCVMLALQDTLELYAQTRTDIVPLFIQSREFADLVTSQDRQAQGLSEQWVEKVSRLAEVADVVVVIDSLDVLSIARDHNVLTYFLAQIDRLLLISRVTVITACRDFDKHYDRRIAARQWDFELKCQPLDWDVEIVPLLDTLGILSQTIDAVTRQLITNPRELALFVELAQKNGSFNVVTSQALAQRYLDTIVRANDTLGDVAIQAIEAIASEMLTSRSLVVPHQRFTASQDIQRKLCSHNVLQVTQDGKLTFGHQTLLDVLVISGAIRSGVTLNEFIQGLPPVPFVRPSIRSFVAQLALGERREFRKQLRTIFTGNNSFHLRRLVAETFAEQLPNDDDWPLLRDLRERHRDVFQVIYTSAGAIEWHHFWLKHLVPFLKTALDAEGLAGHAHRISLWSNEDSTGVLLFWMEVLSLDWLDNSVLTERLGIYLSEIKSGDTEMVAALLARLLNLPQVSHSFLGRVLARCVAVDTDLDSLLWRYVADGISDEDVLEYRFHNKLRCEDHEFGDRNENFFCLRMEKSIALLDLALESIERWSNVYASCYGKTRIGYRMGFLHETSYEDAHSQTGIKHLESMNVLLDSIESAIIHHAKSNTDWWKNNRKRLCFNHEGAVLYFAILACIESPEANIDLIGQMLCEQKILEFELSYELGSLIKAAFFQLDTSSQDVVMTTILMLWDELDTDNPNDFWILKKRAELIVAIPSYMRSPEVQAVLDVYEKKAGLLIRQPDIRWSGGMIRAPFSFEVFTGASDSGVLVLLSHYNGQSDWHGTGPDFLVGGAREVGMQLREASSRQPCRFLDLLTTYWMNITEMFRDDIMNGVTAYLSYRHGNTQSDKTWQPIEEPDAEDLISRILYELERHPKHWRLQRTAAKALNACANVVKDKNKADRIIFLAIGFASFFEEDPIKGDKVSLISLGINMMKGNVAEALMNLATNFGESGSVFPELLEPTLQRFARDEHPAIRAVILRRLPYLQSKKFDLGWDLFHLAIQDANGLWQITEPCLYHGYRNHFEIVRPLLARLRIEGSGKDLETWGRISALAAMARRIEFAEFLGELKNFNNTEAWHGAATVWTNSENFLMHREQCCAGMEVGLKASDACAGTIASEMAKIFRKKSAPGTAIPLNMIRLCFSVFESGDKNKQDRLFRFHEWLNVISQSDPEYALAATEIYLSYVGKSKLNLYDHENNLTQLITRLFSEAEEREESDSGDMLQRVVVVQDIVLSLGVNGVADWLKAAERP
jgi:hypothetical protein